MTVKCSGVVWCGVVCADCVVGGCYVGDGVQMLGLQCWMFKLYGNMLVTGNLDGTPTAWDASASGQSAILHQTCLLAHHQQHHTLEAHLGMQPDEKHENTK